MELLTRGLWIQVNLHFTLCNGTDKTSVLWNLVSLLYTLCNFWHVEYGFEEVSFIIYEGETA